MMKCRPPIGAFSWVFALSLSFSFAVGMFCPQTSASPVTEGRRAAVLPEVKPAAVFEGFHDGADCDKIFGWAWDQSQPNTAISVDIYDGSTRIATVPAGDSRSDLSGKGNGKHAFNYPTPASLKNGQTHSITVKFAGTNTNLSTTPKSLPACSLPDLTNSATPAASYNSGQSNVQFQVTVNRSGGALPTASVYVLDRVYFSSNSSWDSGDTMLWESNGSTPDYPVSVMNSNGTKTVTATMNIPTVSAGTYYIIVFVDPFTSSYPSGYEPESNENNNIAVYQVTINSTQQLPDLTNSANPAASYNPGQSNVQFQVTVNRSGGPIPASSVYVLDRVYFSTNSSWDSGDTMLWESNGSTPDYPVGVLNSNGTKTVTATVNIPNVSAGTYYIIAFVDPHTTSYPNGYEPESNENNNITAYQVTINSPPQLPDLTTSANPAGSYNAGQSNVQFQVTVNRSGGPIPASSVYVLDRVYFSSNSTWDSGDTLLWESNGSTPDYPVGVLNSNGNKTVTATMNIPNVAGGTYYIISFVDPYTTSYPNGYEPESNENNNTAVYQITINGSAGPVITSSPPSGPQVTTNFLTAGSGFTPNGQIRQFLTFPGQLTPQEISQIKADSQGKFSYTYTTHCSDNPGTFTLYMIDVSTGKQSNSVPQTVTATSGCNAPNITINPPSVSQGTSLQVSGSGFTSNGQVRRFTVFPNGVTYELAGTTASGSGQISITVPTDCNTMVGTYTTYMLDVASGAQSIRAGGEVTANNSCSVSTSLVVEPGSGAVGTPFKFTGHGFTPNGIAALKATKPDNSSGGGGQYNVDGSGNVTFVITSQPTDPIGSWTFLLSDSAGKAASTTAQYTNPQTGGADSMYYTDATVDVNYPDNAQVVVGSNFTKTWRLQNNGTSTWNGYTAVFIASPNNGNPSVNLHSTGATSVAVPTTSPGQTINLSIPMKALNPGTYYSYWQLQSSNNSRFGKQFYIKIRVGAKQSNAVGYGTQTGSGGTKDSPAAKYQTNRDPVNTATGNYNYASTDLRVSGRGLDIAIARFYNSQDTTPGPMGNGWSHTFNIFLTNITATGVSVHYSDGKVLDYINQVGTNTFVSSYQGFYDTLIQNSDGTWTLKKSDQHRYQFNSAGKLLSIQDRNNNQISLSYNGANLTQVSDTVGRVFNFTYSGSLLTAIVDPLGRTLQLSYDSASRLTSFRDANGNTNNYVYDANNRLARIVDGRNNNLVANTYIANCPPAVTSCVGAQADGRGNQWTFGYNSDGTTSVYDPFNKESRYVQDTNFNIQKTQDRNATSTQYPGGPLNVLYDDKNNRNQTTDSNGNYTAYAYDLSGNITARTDAMLNLRRIEYDANNNPTRVIDELGNATRLSYDTNGNLSGLTDALNNSSSTSYDSFGQPITVSDANGNASTRAYDSQGNLLSVKDALNNVTSYTYDAVGRRLTMTDARGKTTRYAYDNNDNLLTVTDPLGNVTTFTYDANNNRVSTRDARGNATTYTYDENNNLIKETDAKGNFVQHTYDAVDQRISTRDKRGNVTTYTYDNEGRLLTITDSLANKIAYSYDANGNRLQVTDAKGQTTRFTYDGLNRVTQIQDSLGKTIKKQYDARGQLAKEIDPNNQPTSFTYDAVGNLIQVNDAAGGVAKYGYDANRNRISQTDPNNHTSNVAYDKLNRVLLMTDPLSHSSSYAYDEVGNRISQTDAKGQTTRYVYDAVSRLTTITYPDNSTVQFTRDANGNVTRMVDSIGTSNYTYDELNRLISYVDAFGKTIGYQYDENGNLARLTYPDNKQVTYQYDADNRMGSLTDWAGKTTSFQYDSANLLTRVSYPNGVVSTFTYDNAGRLMGKSDSSISSYSFTLDNYGNRIQAAITQPLTNRLQNTSQSSAYNAANQIQTAGAATFTFDNNGNMTSKTEGGATTNYGYDFQNRLSNVSGSSQYAYDGAAVRLQKVESGKATRYVVDSNHELSQVLCETDGTGAITAYYVYGLGLAYKVSPNGTHYYYSFDPLGSTVAMTDDAKTVINSYAYDPFGKVTNSVEGTSNPFQFVGQYGVMQEANGLQFMRARYYEPNTARFLNKDYVVGYETWTQDLNLFLYTNNGPTNLIDPTGEVSWGDVGRFAKRVANETVAVVKTVPAFVACAGTGGRTPGLCEKAGYDEVGQAVLKYSSTVATKFILDPVIPGASKVLEGYDAAYDAGTYAEAAIRLARGQLSIDEALRIARDAALQIQGGPAEILGPLLDKLDDMAVNDAQRSQIAAIRAQRRTTVGNSGSNSMKKK